MGKDRMMLAIIQIGSEAKPDYTLAVGKKEVTEEPVGLLRSKMPQIGLRAVTVDEAPQYLKEFVRLIDAAANESTRGAVLLYAAMLDEQLKRSIDAFLVNHPAVAKLTEGFNAPIGTFSARTLMAFGLGLISETEFNELILIRKIRNEFAHSIETKFEDPSISSRCKILAGAIPEYPEPLEQFTASAASLVLNLLNRAHYAARKRLSHQEWKL